MVRHCPALHTLNLSFNLIGPLGGPRLARALEYLPNLRVLNIMFNDLRISGIASVTAVLPRCCPQLESLNVSDNALAVDGTAHLAACLPKLKHLRSLSMCANQFELRAAQHLSR